MVAPLSHPIVTWFTRAFITALPSAVRVATCVGPCAAATEPISARVVTKWRHTNGKQARTSRIGRD